MVKQAGYWVDLETVKFDDSAQVTTTWIQALPLGTYDHPTHGKIEITPQRVQQFAANVNNRVRSTELDIDYDHKEYGGEAAGWIKQADARTDGLWILIEWTKKAYGLLRDRAYRYFSPEFADEWVHPKTGEKFRDVLFGGGITNRPFLKDILPINMSELFNTKLVEGGKSMTPDQLKELAKLLGLPEDASGDQVLGALQVTLKVPGNTDPNDPANPDGSADGETQPPSAEEKKGAEQHPAAPPVAASEIAELKKLAESNPAVKLLTEQLAMQAKQLAENSQALKLSEVTSQVATLSEVAKTGGFAIPPTTKTALQELLMDAPTKQFSEKIVKAFTSLMSGKLVSLSEDGHARGNAGESTATKRFNDTVDAYMKSHEGVPYSDAVLHVAQQDPKMFEEYRSESFAGRE